MHKASSHFSGHRWPVACSTASPAVGSGWLFWTFLECRHGIQDTSEGWEECAHAHIETSVSYFSILLHSSCLHFSHFWSNLQLSGENVWAFEILDELCEARRFYKQHARANYNEIHNSTNACIPVASWKHLKGERGCIMEELDVSIQQYKIPLCYYRTPVKCLQVSCLLIDLDSVASCSVYPKINMTEVTKV